MNNDGKRKRTDSSASASKPISAVFLPLLLPLLVAVGLVALNSSHSATMTTTSSGGRDEPGGATAAFSNSEAKVSWKRWLQGGGGGASSSSRKFDLFYAELDMCRVNSDSSVDDDDHEEDFESCNTTKFPICRDNELICYNRRPSRSMFYNDTRQPVFFIDYRNVYCYSANWEGCSSCSPGRLCASESRCILDDDSYPCEKWF